MRNALTDYSSQYRQEDSEETNLIDVDHPQPEPESQSLDREPSPDFADSSYATANSIISARASTSINDGNEWSSPALIKRARTSYGSLFDKHYDPFAEEDGTIRGKGRKRTRLSSTWRYESRSPSPEAEQEQTIEATTGLEVPQKPEMADEGCQTVGLDDDDAVGILADFHRHVQNVESNSHAVVDGTVASERLHQAIAPTHDQKLTTELPLIQTQLDSAMPAQAEFETPARKVLSSPRLQPVSSDALSSMSPLITNRFGTFLGMGPMEGIASQALKLNHDISDLVEDPVPQDAGNASEDLYGASPSAIHSQAQLDELDVFQDASADKSALKEASEMQHQSLPEDQYGHWQSITAQLSHSASPQKTEEHSVEEEEQNILFQEERPEELSIQADGFPLSKDETQEPQHYPDPDDVYGRQQGSASWCKVSERAAYPILPVDDAKHSNNHVKPQGFLPKAVAMSRSGSAQSAPVDLTESSEEEELAEGNGRKVVNKENFGEKIAQGDFEHEKNDYSHDREDNYRSFGDESSEDDSDDSLTDDSVHGRHLQDSLEGDDENASQNSQYERESYQDGIYEDDIKDDEQYEEYPPGFSPEQGEDPGEEEDEDMDEDDLQHVEQEPEVIDLLSSDEEDGREPGVKKPASNTITSPDRPNAAESPRSESEPDESDVDIVAEDFRNEQYHLSDSLAPPKELATSHRSKEDNDDEDKDDEDEDDEVEDGEDEDDEDEDDDDADFAVEEDNGPFDGDNNHGDLAVEQDEELVDVEQDNDASDSEDENVIKVDKEDTSSGNDEHTVDPMALDQEREKMLPNEDLEGNEIQQVIPEVEGKESQEGDEDDHTVHEAERDSHEESKRDALQEAEENHVTARIVEQGKEHVSSDMETSSKQLSGEVTPQRDSLFTRSWNIDGANDESPTTLYPRLPNEKEVAKAVQFPQSELSSQDMPTAETRASGHANGQLPTPADTQESSFKDSSEVTITSLPHQTLLLESIPDETVIDPTVRASSPPLEEKSNDLVDGTVVNVEAEPTVTDMTEAESAKISPEGRKSENSSDSKEPNVIVEARNTRSRTRQRNSLEPVLHEEIHSVEKVRRVGPRRSHKRGKSSSSAESPQFHRLTTPSKSVSETLLDEPDSERTDRSPSILLDERSTPKGQDASVELAMAALDSPSKEQPHDLRSNEPGLDMKLKLTRALRTELSEFVSLKVLRFNLTQKVDVLAIVSSDSSNLEKAKSGPRHYHITFNITDQSIIQGASRPVTEVQVYRPYKEALPNVNVGDGILLRSFVATAVKGNGFSLRSSDSSSWAVFKGDGDDVDVRGPPVEYGDGEKKQIALLKAWYDGLDSEALEKLSRANGDKREAVV
jgi:hypothetical protein